jgi:hypothetical protein
VSETDSRDGISEGDSVPGSSGNDDNNTRLYFWGGIIAAIISWLLIPIVGLVAVYCGWKIYQTNSELQGGIIAGVGGLGVLMWLFFLLGM